MIRPSLGRREDGNLPRLPQADATPPPPGTHRAGGRRSIYGTYPRLHQPSAFRYGDVYEYFPRIFVWRRRVRPEAAPGVARLLGIVLRDQALVFVVGDVVRHLEVIEVQIL